MDGQKSQHVTDLSSTNVSEELQTSFFEKGLYNQGLIKEDSQKSIVEKNIIKNIRKQTAPRFVSAPQGKIAEQGENVFLDAIIDSYPPSDISWSKNGIELIPDGDKLKISGEVNKTRLDITNLAVEDGGHYTCKATNSAGGTSCTTDIIVKSMPINSIKIIEKIQKGRKIKKYYRFFFFRKCFPACYVPKAFAKHGCRRRASCFRNRSGRNSGTRGELV